MKRFLPFSSGTRDCVGQSLARMNYTATVAMLMAHFRFELADKVRSSCCLFAVKASLARAMLRCPMTTNLAIVLLVQMGGKEGVLEKQSIALSTLQPEGGLWMHCIPRSHVRKSIDAPPHMSRKGSSGQLEALPEHPGESSAHCLVLTESAAEDVAKAFSTM